MVQFVTMRFRRKHHQDRWVYGEKVAKNPFIEDDIKFLKKLFDPANIFGPSSVTGSARTSSFSTVSENDESNISGHVPESLLDALDESSHQSNEYCLICCGGAGSVSDQPGGATLLGSKTSADRGSFDEVPLNPSSVKKSLEGVEEETAHSFSVMSSDSIIGKSLKFKNLLDVMPEEGDGTRLAGGEELDVGSLSIVFTNTCSEEFDEIPFGSEKESKSNIFDFASTNPLNEEFEILFDTEEKREDDIVDVSVSKSIQEDASPKMKRFGCSDFMCEVGLGRTMAKEERPRDVIDIGAEDLKTNSELEEKSGITGWSMRSKETQKRLTRDIKRLCTYEDPPSQISSINTSVIHELFGNLVGTAKECEHCRQKLSLDEGRLKEFRAYDVSKSSVYFHLSCKPDREKVENQKNAVLRELIKCRRQQQARKWKQFAFGKFNLRIWKLKLPRIHFSGCKRNNSAAVVEATENSKRMVATDEADHSISYSASGDQSEIVSA